MQSTRKLEELIVIDVAKDGVSIVGKYEAEVQAEVTEFLEEGVHVVLVTALTGNLRSVKKVSQSGINVLFTSRLQEGQTCCTSFRKLLRHGYPGIVGSVILLDLPRTLQWNS